MISKQVLCGAAILTILAALASPALAQSSDGIKGVIAPGAKVELVQEGFKFTEGPVGTAKGELYFTDNRANQILLVDRKGKIAVVHENTNNANGLVLTKSGDLLEVQGAGKKVARRGKDGKVTTLAEGIGGKPFMSPNDLFADAKGGIYITDPGPRPVVKERKAYVYYLAPGAKEPVVVDDAVIRPNGLTLTLDGKTLIVDDSVGDEVFAYDVQRDGTVKNRRSLLKIHDIPAGKESGADGMAIDGKGRLYFATMTGVQVFDGKGGYLGTIKVPRQPTNVAFAGKGKSVLFITAREGLYKIATLTRGPKRLGK